MGIALGLAVYFTIWWTTLTSVMPFGIISQKEAGEVVPGSDPGAPHIPNIRHKLWMNTILAAVLWVVVDILYIEIYIGGFHEYFVELMGG
jgi:predicted secreted protein